MGEGVRMFLDGLAPKPGEAISMMTAAVDRLALNAARSA